MTLRGRQVLVTGAGGFIGSHLAERLVEDGASVRALVHYNAAGSRGWLDHSHLSDGMEIIAGDITDRDCVLRVMSGVDVVFHLAALIGIPYSYEAPASYLRTNAEGTLNVLQAARTLGTERVLHTSTSEVYGTAVTVPIAETHPLQGQSPYSASKIAADKIAESYHLSFDVPVVTIRPFNTFGPRQSMRAIIPTIITQCMAGSTVRLGNTAPMRDLNFISNTVDGFVLAAGRAEAVGRTINLGSGREISIADLAALIARLTGCQARILAEEHRFRPSKSEVERLLADNTLARELLGWRPAVDLDQGLRQTIAWYGEQAQPDRAGVYAV